jgi:hypothetical protein
MSGADSVQEGDHSGLVRTRRLDEELGVTCAPMFDVDDHVLAWKQEGWFQGADGRRIRAYDDVTLLRDVLPENDGNAAYLARAGSTGTVLFFSSRPDGVAQIELEFGPWNAVVLAYEDQRFVKLHMTNEEKYPR